MLKKLLTIASVAGVMALVSATGAQAYVYHHYHHGYHHYHHGYHHYRHGYHYYHGHHHYYH